MTAAPELRPKSWIDSIAPYIPGSSKTLDGRPAVKLSSNENPLGTSLKAKEAYREAVDSLSLYPDSGATALREAIGACYNLDPARIIHGTGSDEILHLAAGAYAGQDDEVLYPRYSFSVYPLAARRVGATPVEAPDDDYRCSVDALLKAVTPRTRVVFIANPNNRREHGLPVPKSKNCITAFPVTAYWLSIRPMLNILSLNVMMAR